jgi:signal transduction histidine kinase
MASCCAPTCWPWTADHRRPGQLQQVLMNLVMNAIEAMKPITARTVS